MGSVSLEEVVNDVRDVEAAYPGNFAAQLCGWGTSYSAKVAVTSRRSCTRQAFTATVADGRRGRQRERARAADTPTGRH
jgi:hypothetical protein